MHRVLFLPVCGQLCAVATGSEVLNCDFPLLSGVFAVFWYHTVCKRPVSHLQQSFCECLDRSRSIACSLDLSSVCFQGGRGRPHCVAQAGFKFLGLSEPHKNLELQTCHHPGLLCRGPEVSSLMFHIEWIVSWVLPLVFITSVMILLL